MGARGETLLTGSSGTADLGAAGARPGLLVRPGCQAGTCQGRRVRRGVGGTQMLGGPQGDGC